MAATKRNFLVITNNGLLGSSIPNYFQTYDEALEFAKGQRTEIIIFQAVTAVEVEYKVSSLKVPKA